MKGLETKGWTNYSWLFDVFILINCQSASIIFCTFNEHLGWRVWEGKSTRPALSSIEDIIRRLRAVFWALLNSSRLFHRSNSLQSIQVCNRAEIVTQWISDAKKGRIDSTQTRKTFKYYLWKGQLQKLWDHNEYYLNKLYEGTS